jgi:calcineurin-like phosphoesterase family protein
MSTIWFTSDTHFGHTNVVTLSHRPFSSIEEHDEAIIERWNAVVHPQDQVYHLGDVGLGSDKYTLECVARLKGHKHLITGNHDSVHPQHRDYHGKFKTWAQYFESIAQFARKKIARREVMLSHYPYAGDHYGTERDMQYRLRNEGKFLLHGHTHERMIILQGAQLHVGVDSHNFTPVPLDDVAKWINYHYDAMAALDADPEANAEVLIERS